LEEPRDINLFTTINRELLGDVITQQCAFYKLKLEQTTLIYMVKLLMVNFTKVLYFLIALIARADQEYPESDLV
jgi:hypothetical protein